MFYVFFGGGLGSLARYLTQISLGSSAGTLAVNLIGSLLVGFLSERLRFSEGLKAFCVVGFLGGFTTFSAFSLETWKFESLLKSSGYLGLSVFGSLLLCGLGISMASLFRP
jgi:CrcB protein